MRRKKAGFTLAELMLVVAILAVLAAVTIPGAVALRGELKMAELNDCAREIFLAAQNNLTARKAAGTLKVNNAYAGEENAGNKGSYWLSSTNEDQRTYLLPVGAIESKAAGGHYLIWYDTASATVLEVYYAESALPESRIWDKEYSDLETSHKNERRAALIGYFRGGNNTGTDVIPLLAPAVKLVNGDELTVEVRISNANKQLVEYGASLTVRVEELDDSGVPTGIYKEFSFTNSDCQNDPEDPFGKLVTLPLDSLGDRTKAFNTTCGGITPGANIRATATLSVEGNSKYLPASGVSNVENSLFAGREVKTGDKDTVSIAYARHLQNLDVSFSGLSVGEGKVIWAEQTANLKWKSGNYKSIDANGKLAGYDGKGLEIRGLNSGMFGTTSAGMTLQGIRIVNPVINRSGNVGALANTATGATIKDCRVYATAIDPEKAGNQTEAFAQLESRYAVTGGTVGGFIGSAKDCTISNSFAALSKVSGTTAGGFIGSVIGGTITNCYATAEDLSGAGHSAMFAGCMSATAVSNCYAVGNISADAGIISGFANVGGVISGSYCAVTYQDKPGKDGTSTGVNPAYGFGNGGNSACVYLSGGFTPTESGEKAEPIGYVNLSNSENWGAGKALPGNWTVQKALQTHPYREELSGKAYPFPAIAGLPHYGSWPVAEGSDPVTPPKPDPVPGDGAYDAIRGTEITEVLVNEKTAEEFYIYAGPNGTVDKNSIRLENGSVFNKKDIQVIQDEAGWYKIVVPPKASSSGNKNDWVTKLSITITIKDADNKTVTVDLVFKASSQK